MSLPKGFKWLEYIESTGTQYIDTGAKPNGNTRVVLSGYNLSKSSKWVFGSWHTWYTNEFGFNFEEGSSAANGFRYGGVSAGVSGVPLGEFYLDHNGTSYTFNDISGTMSAQQFTSSYSMYLFRFNAAGSISSGYFVGRIDSCRIYDNGTFVRDYIPCQNASGEVGLWDDVNSEFYGNAGTGAFIAGPEVYGNDNHTLLLLHGEEVVDSSQSSVAISNNGATVSNAQSKFGGSSLYLNGSANLTFSLPEDCFSGTHDWTVDWWEYRLGAKTSSAVFCRPITSSASSGLILCDDNGQGGLSMYESSNGNSHDVASGVKIGNRKLNEWVHRAVVKSNGVYTAYENGVAVTSITYTGSITDSTTPMRIGNYGTSMFYGYLDEFRISDVARWTSNFVPNDKPYEREETTPAAPGNFHIAIRSSSQIMLAWDAVEGAEGYLLYQNGVCVEDTQLTDYTVDVQPFEQYTFEVAAYNEHGLGAAAVLEFSFAPDNPTVALVTDRTAADAASGNEKGRYTAIDLNRVGAVVQYLVRRLQATGMTISLSPKTDWTEQNWVTPASAAAYLDDVRTLRGALKLAESVPQPPDELEAFTYTEANNIELILLALEVHITNMRSTLDAGWAAGMAYTGLYAKEAY